MGGRRPAPGGPLLPSVRVIRGITSYRPTRLHLSIAAGVLVALVVAGTILIFLNSPAAGIHARLDLRNAEHVHVNQPVPIKFDQPVDLTKVHVTLEPAAPMSLSLGKNQILITPQKTWDPTKRYTVRLNDVPDAKHKASLHAWTGSFFTQPRVGVNAISVDGKPADPKSVQVTPKSKVQVAFTVSMKPSTVTFMAGDQPLPAANVQWQPDNQNVTLAVPIKNLYSPVNLTVGANAESSYGDPFTDPAAATLNSVALEPVNTSSGIDGNFKTSNPFEIVLENAGPARPQRGLQQADMVYEYVSEYSISRMTAIYFNKPPDLIGPVRSCRMINPYLTFAFDGWTMCSGASVGTLHYMFGGGGPIVPATINDFDTGNHFFRSGTEGHVAPHNLYTTGDRALTLRQSMPLAPPPYQADPPHPDVQAGDPAGDIDVPLHHVSWSYDGGSQQYLRTDSGTPFIDANTDQQVHAKNVVLLHVPFQDAGWVEDENGGAHSIWYLMTGSGPADIFSDGKVIHGSWHMGADTGLDFASVHTPVWFTDGGGNLVELNSGLTWLHVLGNGQTG